MRVDQPGLSGAARSMKLRAGASIAAGLLLALFASWWLVMGVLFLVFSEGPLDLRNGGLVTFGLGLVPAAWAVALGGLGIGGIRRYLRLREIASLSRHHPDFDASELATDLEIDPLDAQLRILEAVTAGVVVDGPPQAAGRPRVTTMSGLTRAIRPDPSGSVLNGTWRVDRHLSSGGMGAVFQATHVRTGKPAAVKLLLPDARLSAPAIQRFSREARAASALGHPGIVKILDFDVTEDGTHFLVMELLEGETLEDRLAREGHLSWTVAVRIGREIGRALCVAHEAGILHRDLKPGNVFLTEDPGRTQQAVLLDFGLARPLDDEAATRITTTGMVLGTPAYMSPEQARGEPLDVRSDIHALGAVLYEMVTGEPPFMDPSVAGVYAKLLMAKAPSAAGIAPPGLPPALDEVLQCALAKAPDERFESVERMLGRLQQLEEGASS